MKVALITGASRGIGAEVARGLAEDGYEVALIARSSKDLDELCSKLQTKYPQRKILPFAVDVTDEKAVQHAVQKVQHECGRIDLAINNAGINIPGTTELTPGDFRKQLEVNITGAFIVAQAIIPTFLSQQNGYLINVSSVCGIKGFPGVGGYTASKFGLMGLNESLFQELIPEGIKVTALCPSWVDTEMARHAPFPGSEMIQPKDILTTIRYLLSLSPNACPREIVIECVTDPL